MATKIKSAFIRKRNKNYNVYIEYIDETGKTKQKSQGKYITKKDAEKHLIELKNSLNNNKFVVSKDITLVDRCREYMADELKGFSNNTLTVRDSMIKTTISPFFKDIKLKDITPAILQEYANTVYKNHTQASARHRLSFVKAVLNEAYRLKEINDNPTHFIKTPGKSLKSNRKVAQVYDRDEVKLIINSIEGEQIELPILLMLTLGLRAGEAVALRWRDVDFENNIIHVRQNLVYTPGESISFKSPKTEGSERSLSAPAELMDKLKDANVKYDKYNMAGILEYEDLICLNSVLKPQVPRVLISNWYRFLDKNNIRRIRLHDLRHTHATMLLLAGTDMKTVSNRLGHTDIKITMNRYSHVLEEMDKKASENISDLMFK
ncbi:integrase [Clostridium sp. NCR]|nr:integrase [Clostridium sp. NCR]